MRCTLPCPKAAGVTNQVSSPRYWFPWYVINRQIYEFLVVPLFADHIRAPTDRSKSKLADVGNPLVRQLGRYDDRVLTPSPDAKAKGGRGQQASRGHRPQWPSRQYELLSALISRPPFVYMTVFFHDFFSDVRQTAGHGWQSLGTARTPLPQLGGFT